MNSLVEGEASSCPIRDVVVPIEIENDIWD